MSREIFFFFIRGVRFLPRNTLVAIFKMKIQHRVCRTIFDCFAGSDDRTVQLPSNLPDLAPLLLTTAAIFALRSDEVIN